MLKNLHKYLRHSGVWMGLTINPYHWQFNANYSGPTEMDPAMQLIELRLGPIWIRGVIDDRSEEHTSELQSH